MLRFITDARWAGEGHSAPASIPGRLLGALLDAGIAEDPSVGLQSRANEWIALRPWMLHGTVPLDTLDAERFFLFAQGVRGTGMLYINGEAAGPFPSGDFQVDITKHAAGRPEIRVTLAFAADLPMGAPPMPCAGIDGALGVRGVSQLLIEDAAFAPRIVDGYGVLESKVSVRAYMPGRYTFRYAAVYGEETLGTEEITERLYATQTQVTHRFIVPIPKRWTPGAKNEPILIRLLVSRSGISCDDRIMTTGFREVAFLQAPAMQCLVEDTRVFLKGAEWRGFAQACLTPEETDRRVSLLERAHINCLRVYGPESDALYDALDARGILLWQVLPHDAEQAASIIRRVRHRPSLIAYGAESLYRAFNLPADGYHPVISALAAAVGKLDGYTPFFGPIPGGPVATPGRDDLGRGRLYDVLGPTQYPGPDSFFRDMNLDDALIRTVACPAPALSLESLAGNLPFWPPEGPLWLHRALGKPDLPALREWFDADLQDPILAARLLRVLQAETVRYAVERARMRAQGAAGVFVQDMFERLPSLFSTALMDRDTPRPAYYALESALRPLHACARLDSMGYYCGTSFDAMLCLLADHVEPGPVTVRARLYLPDGNILAEAAYDGPPETAERGVLSATLPDHPCALVLRVTAERFGQVLDVNDYTICVALHALLWPMAHAPFAAVRWDGSRLLNDCGQTALCLSTGAWTDPAYAGYGALLPGEIRAVGQEILLEGLNLEPIRI